MLDLRGPINTGMVAHEFVAAQDPHERFLQAQAVDRGLVYGEVVVGNLPLDEFGKRKRLQKPIQCSGRNISRGQ